ncbi:gemin 2 [Lycorma delicatula]|uniref:gemin 2 n=1 Tax=Lycorma delicatula TaxID=130591 RepID=UPI003F50D6D7
MGEKSILLEPVLSVEPVPKDFDPNAIPSNGMEYLQHVQYEAKNCQQVVVADIDVKKFEKQRTANFLSYPEILIKQEFLPSVEWQEERLADFSEVRRIVERRRIMQSEHQVHKCYMPIIESVKGWYKFCVGKYKSQESGCDIIEGTEDTTLEMLKDDVPEDLDGNSTTETKEDSYLEHKQPLLHLLSAMSQVTIIAVLDYHVEWIENKKTDFHHSGSWLYALLACLEIPLIPETCSSIRSLARLAAEHRMKLDSSDDELLSVLNLIICLVGRYFRQIDLADG